MFRKHGLFLNKLNSIFYTESPLLKNGKTLGIRHILFNQATLCFHYRNVILTIKIGRVRENIKN